MISLLTPSVWNVTFLGTFIFSLLLILGIAVIFDFSEKIDDFIQKQAPLKAIVFDYYLNFIPYFATLFAPMRVFLPVSLFLFVCGAVYMLAYVLKMSRTPNFSQTLIVASVMNFMMGLIAEQIAQLRVDLTERMDQPEDSGKSESNKPEA